MSSIKEERYEMAGDIRYIKFSGDYENFDEWKENTKAISRHKGILKYLTKKWDILKEEDAEHDEDLLKDTRCSQKKMSQLFLDFAGNSRA